MDALKERQFHKSDDKSFKLSLFMEKHRYLNTLILTVLNALFVLIRKIYSGRNNKSKVIVVINLHRLGDTVFSIPAVTGIFDFYKDYKIYVLCFEETLEILSLRFNPASLKPISKDDFYLSRKIARKNIREIVTSLNPEMIFDITGMASSASILFNSGADSIIGMNVPYFRGLYDHFTNIRNIPHYMDLYLDVVKLAIPIEDSEYLKSFPPDFNNETKIIIHPFAIRQAKEWNLRKFISLAQDLQIDYEIEIISPPGFIPDDILTEIEEFGIPVIQTLTVGHLIQEIKRCSLFISNDSGPTYIASLLGKATFTIYGPTNPDFSLPYGGHHRFIRKVLMCSPGKERFCFTHAGINCPSNICMQEISVREVSHEVRNFIEKLGIRKSVNVKK